MRLHLQVDIVSFFMVDYITGEQRSAIKLVARTICWQPLIGRFVCTSWNAVFFCIRHLKIKSILHLHGCIPVVIKNFQFSWKAFAAIKLELLTENFDIKSINSNSIDRDSRKSKNLKSQPFLKILHYGRREEIIHLIYFE